MIHDLKIFPNYFHDVRIGIKTFEIRRDDRNFKKGDILKLREWDPLNKEYTGEYIGVQVTYITNFMQKKGYVVMSIKSLENIEVN